MRWYFEDINRQLRLKAIIDSWIGTPFRHRCAVKGKQGGVDCIHFVAEVFKELGVIQDYTVPEYEHDWHLHKSEEKLLRSIFKFAEALKDKGSLKNVGFNDPKNGDIIMFQFGRTVSHASIYYDKRIYQSLTGMRVEPRPFHDKSTDFRKKYEFRIFERITTP